MTSTPLTNSLTDLQQENRKLRNELLAAQDRIAELENQQQDNDTSPPEPENKPIAESKRQLQQSKRRYRKYFNYASDAMYVFNPSSNNTSIGKFIDVNKEAIRRMGYSLDEFLEMTLYDINLHKPDLKVRQMLEKLDESGFATFESIHVTREGKQIPVEINALLLEVEDETLILAGARDITERKQSEQALLERERLYRLLADNVQDVIWTTDINLRPVFISPSIASLSGYKPDRAMPLLYRAIILESPLFGNFKRTPYKTEVEPLHWEGELTRKDGSVIWVESIASPLWGASGRFNGIIGVTRDITRRKEIIFELESAKEQSNRANKAKSEFLANMSHEIRTPMNGILGTLQLLGLTQLSTEQRSHVETALKSGNNLLAIINDILDFSKIEAGKVTIRKETFSPRDLLKSLVSSFQAIAADRDLHFTFEIDDNIPERLVADHVRLRQILSNLIGNAVKFTESGEITVSLQSFKQGANNSSRLKCVVTDTGIGLPAVGNYDLFEPFSQLESSYRKKYKGTGLGLSIVKQLVTLMGGTITLENGQNGGTVVTFDINAEQCEQEEFLAKEEPLFCKTDSGSGSILLVEDEPINQNILRSILEKFNHQVTIAGNGHEALEILKKSMFDCILMDIQMPEMDGLETTDRIRNDGLFADVAGIPIIALTAFAMTGDKEKCLAAGMNGYLSKPVNISELVRVLNKFLVPQKG